ncbi:MAG: NIPSNAP family protein [Aureliella sp.]
MLRLLLIVPFLAIATMLVPQSSSAQEPKINQAIELRTYTLTDAAAEAKLDAYLESALLPALERQGLGPIGVFDQAPTADDAANAKADGEVQAVQVLLVIPGPSVEAVTSAAASLSSDENYHKAAAEYLSTPAAQPLVKRIRSELLMSFNCWPTVTVSAQKREEKPRLFEMRVYESPTENFGDLKVEMFNAGEVPIFLDCKIAPVFMGQALIGDMMPNLTYMTVYDNDEQRQAAWKAFVEHADWQVLKEVEKYKGTVSKIHKSDWLPKPYSQL